MSKEAAIRTGESSPPLLFRQVSPGPGDSTMQFRLLRFWDARKNVKGGPGILLGIELLLIDAEGTVAQGFIGQNRRNQYEKELKCGMIYTLTNYYASINKVMYHVADQRLVICISHASELRKVEEDIEAILTESFRIHSFADFEANCDLRGDLHDSVLCLSSMSSSRVFFDEEVDPTKEYLAWLTTNSAVTSLVNPVEVIKSETLTISEIAVFLKRQPAQWYYIACKDCQTKLNRGPTTLLCPKCGNENATAVANYRVELSVYDNDEQCTFIILGDAGKDLTGRKATELIDAYVQENGGDAAELDVPLPQCFTDTIGQTKKFRIKVGHYNFTSTRMSLTATKIVSAAELPPKNPPLKTPAVTEVENTELAESSGGGASAIEEEKKPKRAKRSG
ncbi:BnaC06g01730D [Brassica napus]|uniref:BnaC06g01730D protein n=1 Tax=Brassica napus TaxID=3708 RepID=A0A078HXN2_BRANA|nr:BnaC06g01730D [Brassica napus]